jgi:parallel beta-helix repeat protein
MKKQRLPRAFNRRDQAGLIKPTLIVLLCSGIFAGGVYLSVAGPDNPGTRSDSAQGKIDATVETFEIDTAGIVGGQAIGVGGQLRINNTLVLNPSSQPVNTSEGQVYFDTDTKEIRYYDGTSFQGLASKSDVETLAGQIPAQQPAVQSPAQAVTNVTQQYITQQTINTTYESTTGNVTETGNNTFTGANTFADVAVEDFTASGAAALQGSLSVTGTTLLGPASASSLLLSSALGVSSGGTGRSSLASNEIVIGQGTGALATISNGVPGLCLISTSGAPAFQTCPGGTGSAGVSSLAGLTGDLLVANSSTSGSTITIDAATSSSRGIASFNATNLTVTAGSVNTIQDITVSAAPTFGGLTVNGAINGQTISANANFTGTLSVAGVITANTITPNASMVIGANGQSLTLQGSASTSLSANDGTNRTTLDFAAPTANVTYRLQSAAAGTYNVCTTAGNCTGLNGGVTTAGGTAGALARFNGSQTLVDSILSESGSTITVNGSLAVNTITSTSALTIGSQSQSLVLQGDGSTRLSAQLGGITNSLLFSAPSGSNKSIVLPNASGTVVVSASGPLAIDANGNVTCASCTTSGGGSGGAVDSLNGINGAVLLNDASVAGSTITINDASTSAKGIASFNSTNFSVTSGAVNTVQDISVSSSPTFNALTLSTPLSVSSGGTGASTASGARTNLGAAASGANTDITSLGGLTTALSVSQGGTGATSSQSALNNISQLSTEGDLLYFNGVNSTRLARGGSGECLTSSTTSIAWGSCGPGEADTLATVTSRGATTNTGVFLQGGATSRGLTIDTATPTNDTISINVTSGGASSFGGQITAADLTANRTWTLPDASGTFCLQGSSSCGFLTGSASNYIQNQNASQQATSNFWVSGTGRADVALQAPSFDTATSTALNIGGTNASVLNLNQNTVLAATKSFTVTGGATGTRPASPTEGMVYFDTTTKQLLTYANGKWQADRSNSTVIVAANDSRAKDSADFVVSAADETAGNADVSINAAIAALPAGGGSVYLMEGTYTIDSPLALNRSNFTLAGSGSGTTIIRLKSATNVSINMLDLGNTSYKTNVAIRDLQVDGNKVNQTAGTQNGIDTYRVGRSSGSKVGFAGLYAENVHIRDMRTNAINMSLTANSKIESSYLIANSGSGINDTSSTNGGSNVFSNNTIQSNGVYGITTSGEYGTVTANTIEGNTSHGVHINSSSTIKVLDNAIRTNGGSGVYLANDNANITGNDIRSNTGAGIFTSSFTIGTNITNNRIASNGANGITLSLGSSDSTITGNNIDSNTGNGVDGSRANDRTVITGNTVSANTVHGILLSGYIYQLVVDNNVSTNKVLNNGSNGILLSSTAQSTVSGNTVANSGGATANNGIVIGNSYSGNNNVSGNTITDTSCTTNCYAITINGTDNQVSSNTIGDGILVDFASNNIYGRGEIHDIGTNTIYSSQRDTNGNLINRGGGGLSVNTNAVTSSLTLQGGLSNTQLPTPAQPKVATAGTAGTTNYGYRVTALDGTGETLPSTERTVATGNAVLNATNYNVITWSQVQGAVQYKVYRTTSGGTPASTGLIATVTGANNVFFNDTGIAATTTVPGSNTTGGATIAGTLQGSSATLSGGLTVAGTSTLNGALNVAGVSLFRNSADSTAAFSIQNSSSVALFTADTLASKITIRSLDVSMNLTIAGHIITAGSNPTIAANTAACTTPTVSVSGTDTAGSVTVTTGTGCAAPGDLATITFATAFGATPKVVLTPASANAAGLNAYLDDASLTTSNFRIGVVNTPTDATTYKWHYYALQ